MSPSWCRGRAAAAGTEFSRCLESSRTRPKSANWKFYGEEKVPRMRGAGGEESEGFNLISEDGTAAPLAHLACEECLTAPLLNMTHMSRRPGVQIPATTDACKTAHKQSFTLKHVFGLSLLMSEMSHWHPGHPKPDYLPRSVCNYTENNYRWCWTFSSNRRVKVQKFSIPRDVLLVVRNEESRHLKIISTLRLPDQTKYLLADQSTWTRIFISFF